MPNLRTVLSRWSRSIGVVPRFLIQPVAAGMLGRSGGHC
jgi:hypothetical protein